MTAHASEHGDRLPLAPATTALLVVDAQKAFLSPDGTPARNGLDVERTAERLPAVRELVDVAREHDVTTVYTRSVRRADGRDAPQQTYRILPDVYDEDEPSCCAGTEDVAYADGIDPAPSDFEVTKKRYDAFSGTPLAYYLRSDDIETVVVCGFMTNVCVESTARSAHERGYDVVVPRDACAASTRDAHESALRNVDRILGTTASVDEVTAALEADSRPE
jgi:ureidoacrylate peracid hydrolase